MKKKSQETPMPEYFTKEYVAGYLSVSTKTVERMFSRGLKSFVMGRKRYISKDSLLDYINRHSASA
jgi:excisionase family DNA binding protein